MEIVLIKKLEIYVTKHGKNPFIEWLGSFSDKTIRYRIKTRLDRVVLGNLGDHKFVKSGVYELCLAFGSGYRIYYGNCNRTILLLCGGDKISQNKDIEKAIIYLQDYLTR